MRRGGSALTRFHSSGITYFRERSQVRKPLSRIRTSTLFYGVWDGKDGGDDDKDDDDDYDGM